MSEIKVGYSDEDLQEFKALILKKIERAESDLALLQSFVQKRCKTMVLMILRLHSSLLMTVQR